LPASSGQDIELRWKVTSRYTTLLTGTCVADYTTSPANMSQCSLLSFP